jgi:TRAP-type C4-dicarboxylate transport system permease small subunit
MALLLKIETIVVALEKIFVLATLVGLTGLQIAQVIFRYVLNNPVAWVDELSRYVFIWMIMIGAGMGMAKSAHFNIDFIKDAMPRAVRKFFVLIAQGTVIVFSGVVIFYGSRLLGSVSNQITPALSLPFSLPYAAVPTGAALILYHALMKMLLQLRKGPSDTAV